MHDWDSICGKHGPLVWATVYRVLGDHAQALDCYQDVFVEAFERTQDRTVADWPSLLRWLAVRRAIDRLRQRTLRNRRVASSNDLTLCPASDDGPLEAVQFTELMERVSDELAVMPARQAEAFWLRCVEQMSYVRIGEQLGLGSNEVGVLIHRAKVRLRATLASFNPGRVKE